MADSDQQALEYGTVASRRCVEEPAAHIEEAGRKAVAGSDRVAPATDRTIDLRRTQKWAIAPLFSVGLVTGYSAFELVNRETGRAHTLHIPTGGLSTQLPPIGEGVSNVSYTTFETARPVNFADFSGIGARVISLNASLLAGYSAIHLTLWDGSAFVARRLAEARMGGWTIASLPGGMWGHGFTVVSYGSGKRTGTVPLTLTVVRNPELPPRLVDIQVAAMEGPRVDVPADILFDFDSAKLRASAREPLLYLADLLNNRLSLPVEIEGHTDAIGSPEYNMRLSRRRAEAVHRWFTAANVLGAERCKIRPYGEKNPIAPNTHPDGSDNPEGRRQNRRVTVVGEWNV
ncbi:OmpA family protein (plasmid) [Haloferacaceae archaeon DSL9]